MDKNVKMLLIILAIVGGLVHVLAPLGINLLGFLGGLSPIVQFVAGVATIIVVWPLLKM